MTDQGLTDIGANLTAKPFQRHFDALLARAAAAGVTTIFVTGTTAAASRRALEMTEERRGLSAPRLFATAGIHPHNAVHASPEALDEIRALLPREGVVAAGECGLDYHRTFSPPDRQRACFEAQLEIASAANKPVFLHERDAYEDFAPMVERWRPKLMGGVVHCFTGSRAALERYLALDLHIGITGWICDERRGAHLRELVRVIPEGRLLLETDAPYLLPRDLPNKPMHGRNEPSNLAHVARAVAACRGEPVERLAAHTTAAAVKLFNLR